MNNSAVRAHVRGISENDPAAVILLEWAWLIVGILDHGETVDPHNLGYLTRELRREFIGLPLMKYRDVIFRKITEGHREHAVIEALQVIIIMAEAQGFERCKDARGKT